MNFKQLSLFALALCFSMSAFAQGALSGKMVDEATGEPLLFANLLIVETAEGVATDLDGNYQLDLAPGTYTLEASYTGYQTKRIEEVTIEEGETTYLDIALSDAAVDLGVEVVVTAEVIERSENAVMLLQKRSEKIQDGISSQEMSRYGVGNVAAAMTKVTGASIEDGKYINIRGLGDRYSISQLNGLNLPSIDPYRNSAQLDLIPTNLLDNLITAKTFTPDQPGTFTGGNLDIRTKSFPEREVLNVSISVGYNPQNNLIDDFLTYDGSDRDWIGYGSADRQRPDILNDPKTQEFLGRDAELQAFRGNEDAANTIDAVANAFDYQFTPDRTTSPVDHGISFSYGNNYAIGTGQLGLILSGGYKRTFTHVPDGLNGRWELFDLNSANLLNRGLYDNQRSEESPVVNGMVGLAYKFNPSNTIDFKVLYNHNTEKQVDLIVGPDGQNIEAPDEKRGRGLLYNEREMINYQLIGRHVLSESSKIAIDWAGSLVNSSLDQPDLRFFNGQFSQDLGTEGLTQNLEDPLYFWRDLTDNIFNGKVDLTIPISGAESNKVKFGGFYSLKDRDFNEFQYSLIQSPNAIRFSGDFDEAFGPDNNGVIRTDEGRNGLRYIVGNYIENTTVPTNSYVGEEEVIAAYGMLTYNLGENLKFVGGVRLETTDINVESKNELAPDSVRLATIDKVNWLPSLNFIYSLTEDMNLRATYSQTIARPNLREIGPFASFDPLRNEFFVGNQRLTTTDVQNADVRWEWFFNPGEIIALSGFYKNFDNPIALTYRRASNPEFQYVNVESGYIYGLEFEVRKGLGFLAPALEDLKLGTNLALIQSDQDVKDETGLEPESRPFTGQAPLLANVNLNYSNQDMGLDVTLAYNFVGDKLAIIGREGTPDYFERARNMLDFIASKQFDKVTVGLSAKNLLDATWLISNEFKGNEYIFDRFQRGISFGLSLSYDLL